MIKFTDDIHEWSEGQDGFEIEVNKKGEVFVRIYEMMDSGIVREFYLSYDDIKQINSTIIEKTKEDV
jgi:hypothetical protein